MAVRGRRNADEALAVALAAGATVQEAAATVGISERTVFRRKAEADFKALVKERQAEMYARAAGRLADSSAGAAEALSKLLKAKSETVQLGAARAILEMAPRLRESVELAAEILSIKAQLAAHAEAKRK